MSLRVVLAYPRTGSMPEPGACALRFVTALALCSVELVAELLINWNFLFIWSAWIVCLPESYVTCQGVIFF